MVIVVADASGESDGSVTIDYHFSTRIQPLRCVRPAQACQICDMRVVQNTFLSEITGSRDKDDEEIDRTLAFTNPLHCLLQICVSIQRPQRPQARGRHCPGAREGESPEAR